MTLLHPPLESFPALDPRASLFARVFQPGAANLAWSIRSSTSNSRSPAPDIWRRRRKPTSVDGSTTNQSPLGRSTTRVPSLTKPHSSAVLTFTAWPLFVRLSDRQQREPYLASVHVAVLRLVPRR